MWLRGSSSGRDKGGHLWGRLTAEAGRVCSKCAARMQGAKPPGLFRGRAGA